MSQDFVPLFELADVFWTTTWQLVNLATLLGRLVACLSFSLPRLSSFFCHDAFPLTLSLALARSPSVPLPRARLLALSLAPSRFVSLDACFSSPSLWQCQIPTSRVWCGVRSSLRSYAINVAVSFAWGVIFRLVVRSNSVPTAAAVLGWLVASTLVVLWSANSRAVVSLSSPSRRVVFQQRPGNTCVEMI